MNVALDIFLDALKDSAIILPFLFLVYVLIEVIEMYSVTTLKAKHMLQGKFSPLIASSVGLIPQCGFSVVATDLFSKKYISVGTLLAVFIATSDEAIPIMLSNLESAKMLVPMLIIKFISALIIGYGVYFIQKFLERKKVVEIGSAKDFVKKDNQENNKSKENKVVAEKTAEISTTKKVDNHNDNIEENHNHNHNNDCDDEIESVGCCGHHLDEQPSKLKKFLWHPLIHSLKIFLFILIVNLILGTVLHFVGEEKLAVALGVDTYWQPLVSALIGLIPNCASSVAITGLYVAGTLSFGACVAGLTANAGVAYVVLFKHNKNLKQNLLIVLSMYVISIVIGFITMLIF